jgi:hypothetical protein
MSSSSARIHGQRGGSIIEALVATALLGITATVAITGWDTAVLGANRATHEAWSRCMARTQMQAILAAPWLPPPRPGQPSNPGYPVADSRVKVDVVPWATTTGLEQVTVRVGDLRTGGYTLSALKASGLSGDPHAPQPNVSPIPVGCLSP